MNCIKYIQDAMLASLSFHPYNAYIKWVVRVQLILNDYCTAKYLSHDVLFRLYI